MAIAQFENGLITKNKMNELVNGINGNSESIATIEARVLTANITKTVGVGGDFATLNEAINWCKRVIPNGYLVTISILSGTIIAEQVMIENVDLSFVQIDSIDIEVVFLNSSLIQNSSKTQLTAYAFMSGYNSKMPTINTLFKNDGVSPSYAYKGVLLENNSSIIIKLGKGIKNSGGENLYITGGCSAICRGGIFTGSVWGNGVVIKNLSVFDGTNATSNTVEVYNSRAELYGTSFGIIVREGASVYAKLNTGAKNIDVNTFTGNGMIFV